MVCISDLAEMQKTPEERSPLHFLAFLLRQNCYCMTKYHLALWNFLAVQFNHC